MSPGTGSPPWPFGLEAFAKADVLDALPRWKSNPAADFSGIVDTPRLFEFIEEVRNSVWTQSFTEVVDVTDGLRRQLAYRMTEGLRLQRQLQGVPKEYSDFSGPALRIAAERLPGWQGLLLAQLIEDEIKNAGDLRLSYDEGISFGAGERVADAATSAWQAACLDQATRLTNGLTVLLNKALNDALSAKDGARIASCARLIGTAYRDALEWAIGLRRTHVTEDWRAVVQAMSLFTRNIVVQIEGLAEVIRRDLRHLSDLHRKRDSDVISNPSWRRPRQPV